LATFIAQWLETASPNLLAETSNWQAGLNMSSTQGQGKGAPVSSQSKVPKIKKGLWSPEEDMKLINYMRKNDHIGCSWSYVAKKIGN
jgi:hypothetical protein